MPYRVLLVERDSSPRRSLKRALDHEGHAVVAVNSIGEALARLRSSAYDVVVLTGARESRAIAEEYELLIDASSKLATRMTDSDAYLPGIGIHTSLVLIVASREPHRVSGAVRDCEALLRRRQATQAANQP